MPIEPPQGWGADPITEYLEKARNNSFATFNNLKSEYGKLSDIDAVFRKIIDNLNNTKHYVPAFFLFQAHSSYRVAVSLGMAGQVSEAYAAMRLSLENALYGFHIFKNPALADVWISRQENDESRKKVRDEFKFRKLIDSLKTDGQNLGDIADTLYNRTIAYGAHPNERALTQRFVNNDKKHNEFKLNYLIGDNVFLSFCLKSIAQVGVCILDIFRIIFKERFDLLDLTSELERLKTGL